MARGYLKETPSRLLGLVVFWAVLTGSFMPVEAASHTGRLTWSGQVRLENPLVVPQGQTLYISAGTRIQVLHPEDSIILHGRLLIEGREDAPVIFSSPPGWSGISLQLTSRENLIRNTWFEGARVAAEVIQSQLTVVASRFVGCDTALAFTQKSTGKVRSCNFSQGDRGLVNDMRSTVTVSDSHFSDFRQAALTVSRLGFGRISGNRFVRNRAGVVISQEFSGSVTDNFFKGNSTAVSLQQTQRTPQLSGNLFTRNEFALRASQFSSPHIRGNVVRANQTGVQIDKMSFPQVAGNEFVGNRVALDICRKSRPLVRGNRFENNKIGLLCDYSSYPWVKQNNFVDNPLAVKLGDHQSAEYDGESEKGSVRRGQAREVLLGPENPQNVEMARNGVFDVSSNWWGAQTPELLAGNEGTNISIFWDRHDQPYIPVAGKNQTYRRDLIFYRPILQKPAPFRGIDLAGRKTY